MSVLNWEYERVAGGWRGVRIDGLSIQYRGELGYG